MNANDQHQTSQSKLPPTRSPTRCYEKPELRDYGDIRTLTQDRGLTGPTDGGTFPGFLNKSAP